jgi:hypothetical protein
MNVGPHLIRCRISTKAGGDVDVRGHSLWLIGWRKFTKIIQSSWKGVDGIIDFAEFDTFAVNDLSNDSHASGTFAGIDCYFRFLGTQASGNF